MRKRPDLNIKAVELAERMSVTKPVISGGRTGRPTVYLMDKRWLAKALDTSVESLLVGSILNMTPRERCPVPTDLSW